MLYAFYDDAKPTPPPDSAGPDVKLNAQRQQNLFQAVALGDAGACGDAGCETASGLRGSGFV